MHDNSMPIHERAVSVRQPEPVDHTPCLRRTVPSADEDSLSAARGVLLALVCMIPIWLIVLLVVSS